MGMYDNVRYSAPCKGCGKLLLDWQTKDGECLLDTLEIDPEKINRWYASCLDCDTWNEKRIKVLTWEIVDA